MKQDIHSPLPDHIEPSWRVGIVASTYHGEIIDQLVEGARAVFREAGLPAENVRVHRAPGSFEVPLIGAALVVGVYVENSSMFMARNLWSGSNGLM